MPEQVTTAGLGELGELDYFTFTGVPGTAQLSLVALSGFAGSVPRATLLAPDGTELGTFDADALESFELRSPAPTWCACARTR